jgi:hypothetical protein
VLPPHQAGIVDPVADALRLDLTLGGSQPPGSHVRKAQKESHLLELLTRERATVDRIFRWRRVYVRRT